MTLSSGIQELEKEKMAFVCQNNIFAWQELLCVKIRILWVIWIGFDTAPGSVPGSTG